MPDDDDLEALLDEYLDPPAEPNVAYSRVVFDWIDGDDRVGSRHMSVKHGVSKTEV